MVGTKKFFSLVESSNSCTHHTWSLCKNVQYSTVHTMYVRSPICQQKLYSRYLVSLFIHPSVCPPFCVNIIHTFTHMLTLQHCNAATLQSINSMQLFSTLFWLKELRFLVCISPWVKFKHCGCGQE